MRTAAARAIGLITTTLAATLAQAGTPVLVDFETPPGFVSIGDHYSDLGIGFGADVLALQNDALGPYFDNAPSPTGVMFVAGPDATMNVAAGFTTGVMLWVSSSSAVPQAVQVYSGLDGTGQLLASLDLPANAQAGGCSSAPYCHFDRLAAGFAGTAHSIAFANAGPDVAFDNLTVGAVPEPATALSLALGLGALALLRRRA